MDVDEVICSNPDCKIAIDGKCIEGLTVETCPNYGREPVEDDEPSHEEEVVEPDGPTRIDDAIVLDAAGASEKLAGRISRVVSIIAPHDAGKTSLIAAVYDAFQRARVGNLAFAGSATLHSFEVACHDSRSASRRAEAAIFRTPLGEVRFYHLDLADLTRDGEVVSLLVSDRAGEQYLKVASDLAESAPLFELRRADTLTFLVDGCRLCDLKERHNVRAEVVGILQGLVGAGLLTRKRRLVLALTKNDAVTASKQKKTALGDFDRLIATIREAFSPYFSEIETIVTAASPKVPDAVRGEGIPRLLEIWMKPIWAPSASVAASAKPRDFDLLKELAE